MKPSIHPAPQARLPDYQRIALELRQQIISGKFAPRSRLPSTGELAVTWKSSVHTVHNALALLAKEGWIERIHGAGTFVAEPKGRFVCAGIYHESDIGSDRVTHFARTIHDSLLEQFAHIKKETQVFVDSRPANMRGTLLPALAEAIQHRDIQCLVAPTATFNESPSLARLTLPTAFTGNFESPNLADFDREDFLREGIRCLVRQGCRSVGMIYPFPYRAKKPHIADIPFHNCFPQVIREEGLETRPEWVSKPSPLSEDYESFGYIEFQRMWKLRQKPEGIIVFPDTTVRGVITAALKFASDAVPSKIKFVFHRNAHMKLICPFPVTWAISDEDALAKKLVQIIEKQFRGEKVSPALLAYEMRPDDGLRWQ